MNLAQGQGLTADLGHTAGLGQEVGQVLGLDLSQGQDQGQFLQCHPSVQLILMTLKRDVGRLDQLMK